MTKPTEKQINEAVQKACVLAWWRTAEEPDLGIEVCLEKELKKVSKFKATFPKISQYGDGGESTEWDVIFYVDEEAGRYDCEHNTVNIFREDIVEIEGQPPELKRILNIFNVWAEKSIIQCSPCSCVEEEEEEIQRAKNKKILGVWNMREDFFGQSIETKRVIFSLIPEDEK